MKTTLLSILLCLGAGCMTQRQQQAMNSWIGHHESELILAKGPPGDREPDGDGGQVLIWTSGRHVVHNYNPGVPLGGGYYTASSSTSRVVEHSTMFYVHSDGTIYHWRVQ